jgi:plasmid stability protein
MSQLVVSDLDESLETELKSRARSHGWSVEEEVRQILRQSLAQPLAEPAGEEMGLGTRIASLFAGGEFEYEVPELRGYTIEPMEMPGSSC